MRSYDLIYEYAIQTCQCGLVFGSGVARGGPSRARPDQTSFMLYQLCSSNYYLHAFTVVYA